LFPSWENKWQPIFLTIDSVSLWAGVLVQDRRVVLLSSTLCICCCTRVLFVFGSFSNGTLTLFIFLSLVQLFWHIKLYLIVQINLNRIKMPIKHKLQLNVQCSIFYLRLRVCWNVFVFVVRMFFVNIIKADRERMSNARHRDNHLMSSGKFKRAYFA